MSEQREGRSRNQKLQAAKNMVNANVISQLIIEKLPALQDEKEKR
jgi:hypothetical protein